MKTTEEIKVRLPRKHMEFLKWYASRHDTTVESLFKRYAEFLQPKKLAKIPKELKQISGVIPSYATEDEYYEGMRRKHS